MIEVKNGKVFVEGVETIDTELIGIAFLDFAESLNEKGLDFDSGHIYSDYKGIENLKDID